MLFFACIVGKYAISNAAYNIPAAQNHLECISAVIFNDSFLRILDYEKQSIPKIFITKMITE